MARFLTTKQIEAEIESVLRSAKERVAIISPYLRLSKILVDRLNEVGEKGIRFELVYGDKPLDDEQMNVLKTIKDLEVYYLQNLHAKIYGNETRCVVSSMNLYEKSETANREMGVLLSKDADREAFDEAWEEIESILKAAEIKWMPFVAEVGVCIRCGFPLEINPGMPLCEPCYSEWARYSNVNYEEKYCHVCGNPSPVSKARPLCIRCYKESLRPRSARPEL